MQAIEMDWNIRDGALWSESLPAGETVVRYELDDCGEIWAAYHRGSLSRCFERITQHWWTVSPPLFPGLRPEEASTDVE